MEASLKTQMKVGLFLAIGIFIVMLSIFMIGGNSSFFSRQVIHFAHFSDVQGLAEGSLVSLAGLSVGNVEKIEILPDENKLRVSMKIDGKIANRITEGTEAEIRTQGALGDKFIYLVPGDPRNKTLPEGSVLAEAAATDLLGVLAARGKETEKVFDVINEVYIMAKSINREGRLEKIMTNLSSATSDLKVTAEQARMFSKGMDFETSSVQLKNSLRRLDSVMEKIDRGEGTLGALINDSTLHDQLRSFLGVSPRKQQMRSLIRTSIERGDQ